MAFIVYVNREHIFRNKVSTRRMYVLCFFFLEPFAVSCCGECTTLCALWFFIFFSEDGTKNLWQDQRRSFRWMLSALFVWPSYTPVSYICRAITLFTANVLISGYGNKTHALCVASYFNFLDFSNVPDALSVTASEVVHNRTYAIWQTMVW